MMVHPLPFYPNHPSKIFQELSPVPSLKSQLCHATLLISSLKYFQMWQLCCTLFLFLSYYNFNIDYKKSWLQISISYSYWIHLRRKLLTVMARFAVNLLFCFLFCFYPHKQDFLRTVMKLTNVSKPRMAMSFLPKVWQRFSMCSDFENWKL